MAKRKKKAPGEGAPSPETSATPRAGAEPPASPEPKSKAKPMAGPGSRAKSRSKPGAAPEPEAAPAPKPKPKAGAKSQPKPRPKADAPAPSAAGKKAAAGGAKKASARGSRGGKKAASNAGKPRGRRAPRVDWRMIEAAMWRMLGREAPDDVDDPASPRAIAADLLHKAYLDDEPARVESLAREALTIWPDCADAHVLLAETTRAPHEAIAHYERAVEAARRDLGPAAFEVGRGHFWSILPTRPYMRALYGLAQVLWVVGRRDDAAAHYRELILLNPGDNQGVRYRLALALIEMGRDGELATFLRMYEDDESATWAYTRALHAFRTDGDSPRTRALLAAALRTNRHVPDYLLGRESFPSEMAATAGVGDRSEAVDYAAGALNGWRSTPGSLDWLRKAVQKGRPRTPKDPTPRGPTPASLKRLAKLPQSDEVWFADARLLPIWINVPDDPYRPWVLLVADVTGERVIGQEICNGRPAPNLVWDQLARFMARSESDARAHRPTAIELGAGWEELAVPLAALDIEARPFENPEIVDELVGQLVEHVQGRPSPPALLQMPGVREAQVGAFYEAAAEFYRAAPWRYVGGAETVKVDCDRFESGPWYAVVFGQMGMTLGVALYEDLDNLVTIRDGHASDEENARATVALSLTYGTKIEIPVEDLDAVEAHGWEIAAPDAYPSPVRKERGLTMRPPLAWELQLLEAVLRALPTFLLDHDRGDPTPEPFPVDTGLGPITLELSWVVPGPSRR